MNLAIVGVGPHGRECARCFIGWNVTFYDDFLAGYDTSTRVTDPYIAGAAWPKVRRQIAEHVKTEPWGNGNVIFPRASVSPSALLKSHVHVGYNAVVTHGCAIGDFVTICPGAVLSGDVRVEDDVFIGANATVIHGGLTIGRGAIVGAGAVVISDVPPGATVVGNPARVL